MEHARLATSSGGVTGAPKEAGPAAFGATLDWLMAGDPAIRWQTKRDLYSADDHDIERERSLVATIGWGRELLDRQESDGTWGGGLYGPKWTSTTYTLQLLSQCGLPRDHPEALRGVEKIWDGARYFDGGLTCAASIDAPEACVTSIYINLAAYFGYHDSRLDDAIDWLLANQLSDGGWNCRTIRFGDQHSSFHTSILALEALAEIGKDHPRRIDIDTARESGREFFLNHHLYQSHRDGSVAKPAFTKLSFPPRWHYDVLRGLDHFQNSKAAWDDRLTDALAVLAGRKRPDGTWPVQNRHGGKTWFEMEKTGGPSRWNTLRALRVQKWADHAHRLHVSPISARSRAAGGQA